MSELRVRTGLLLAALAIAPALTTARAGDDRINDSSVSFDPRLTNDVKLDGDSHGAQLVFTGRAPNFPDGTALHVLLYVEGRAKAPVRAAFVKVTLEKGNFAGQFNWPNQRLSPMLYKAELMLYIDEQRPDVRRNLIQEYGWPAGHCETLAKQDLTIGTPEERVSFPRRSLEELRGLIDGFEQLRREQLGMAQSTPPAGEEALMEYAGRLGAHEEKFVQYARAYVVRAEGELMQRVQSTIATLSRCVRNQMDGDDPSARLIKCEQELKVVLAEIESRMPLDLGEDGK